MVVCSVYCLVDELVVYWVWMLVAWTADQWAVDWVYYSGLNSADWSVDKRV